MITVLDPVEHDWLKSKTAAGYSGKDVPGLENEVDSVLCEMIDLLRSKYAADASITCTGTNVNPVVDFARIS